MPIVHSQPEFESLPILPRSFFKRILDMFGGIIPGLEHSYEIRTYVPDWLRNPPSARNILVSTADKVMEYLEIAISMIKNKISRSFYTVIDSASNLIRGNLDMICRFLEGLIGTSTKQVICSIIGLIIFAITMALPSTMMSAKGKIVFTILSIFISYSQSFLLAGVGAFLLHLISTYKPSSSVVVDNNIHVHVTEGHVQMQGFSEDSLEFFQKISAVAMLFGAALVGLPIPTDVKSWDTMFRRHALIHKAFSAWEFGMTKVTDLFECSRKMVVKYILKTEYTSYNHVQEVEDLLLEIANLCTLDSQFRIGKDERLAQKITALYIRYMTLCQIYVRNKDVMEKLRSVSGAITSFYRKVSNKNPRANAMRKEPVTMAFIGGTGLGKTYLMTPLQQDLLKICDKLDDDPDLSGKVYARAIEQEFWDGYSGQPIVVFDDFGQKIDSPANPNNEFFEIIRAANIFPYQLHSAELHEKANNPFIGDFICLTTNLETFDPKSIICKQAFRRRIDFKFTISLIDEVLSKKEDGNEILVMLDPEKLEEYRYANDLDVDDFSHVRFKNEDGKTYTYDEIIVLISQCYKKKQKDFENKKKIAGLKYKKKLPPGAFSENNTWTHHDKLRVPENFLLSLTNDQYDQLSQRFEIIPVERMDFTFFAENTTIEGLINDLKDLQCITRSMNEVEFERLSRPCEQEPESFFKRKFSRAFEHLKNKTRNLVIFVQTWHIYRTLPSVTTWYGKVEKYLRIAALITSVIGVIAGLYAFVSTSPQLGPKEACKQILTPEGTDRTDPPASRTPSRVHFHAGHGPEWFQEKYDKLLQYNEIITAPDYNGDPVKLLRELGLAKNKPELILESPTTFKEFKEHLIRVANLVAKFKASKDLTEKEILTIFREEALIDIYFEDSKMKVRPYEVEAKKKSLDQRYEDFLKMIDNLDEEMMQCIPPVVTAVESLDNELIRFKKLYKEFVKYNAELYKLGTVSREQNLELLSKYGLLEFANPRIEKHIKVVESKQAVQSVLNETITPMVRTEGVSSEAANALMNKSVNSILKLYVVSSNYNTYVGKIFMIKGRKALVNFHYVETISNILDAVGKEEDCKVHLVPLGHKVGIELDITDFLQNHFRVYRAQEPTEFVCLTLPPRVPLYPDFTKHLILTKDLTKLSFGVKVALVTITEINGRDFMTIREGNYTKTDSVQAASLIDKKVIHTYASSAHYDIATNSGDCGSPVFLNSDQFARKIAGFHFAGTPGAGCASIITAEDLDCIRDDYHAENPKLVIPQGIINDDDTPLGETIMFRRGRVIPGVKHPCKTTLRQSLIYGKMHQPETAPALLRPALEKEGPMLNAIKKYSVPYFKSIDKGILNVALKNYFDYAIKPYRPHAIEKAILTFEEAVQGIEGNHYFNGLKRTKSAGYPYMQWMPKGKTSAFGKTEWLFDTEHAQIIKKDVEELILKCKQGMKPEVLFVATLKDEKRSLEKIRAKKTRVFAASPVHFTIAFRQYFGGFIAFMMRNKIYNECCVGTNVHSKDWTKLARYLDRWRFYGGTKMMDGDFGNFDGNLHPDIFYSLIHIINDFYNDSKINRRVRTILWECIFNSQQILDDLVIQLTHGQPSGNPSTAITNSMYVSILFRYAFYKIAAEAGEAFDQVRDELLFNVPEEVELIDKILNRKKRKLQLDRKLDFNDYFRLVAYGDDHVISGSDESWNYIGIQGFINQFKELGQIYTDTDKGTNFRLKDLHEVSFLKRGFLYFYPREYYFAPLSMASIYAMMDWIRKSPSDLEATVMNIEDALMEMCHYPENHYENFRDRLSEATKDLNTIITIPNYHEVRRKMIDGELRDTDLPWF